MSDESFTKNKSDDLDFENMKVINLKRKLKPFGLPITGNKSELVKRLQEAMFSEKGVSPSNKTTSDAISVTMSHETITDAAGTDLESSLLMDASEISSTPSASDSVLLEDFSSSSPEKDVSKAVDSTTNSNPASVPLKKRIVAPAPSETVKREKRIVLKRNNIPTPKFIPSEPAVPIKRISVIADAKSEVPKSSDKKNEAGDGKGDKGLPSTIIRLSTRGSKGLSELEKIQQRAKRFNIEPSSKPGKITEAAKQSLISNIISNTPSTSSANLLDMDAKCKRAFRFGINVSNAVHQLEQKKMLIERQQILLKRKSKFEDNPEEQEKKRKRAERFGI